MTKAIIIAVFALAISFFTVSGVVEAQTSTPTPTTEAPAAPSTGFGM